MIKFSNISSIYNEYLDTLYSYGLHLGFDEQSVMDAIHDVFYKLCINYSSLSEIGNLKSYLLRSIRNRLIDMTRVKREVTNLSLVDEDETQEDFPFQLYVTVEDELIMKEDVEEIKQKVESVLSQLTDRQREIVYLRYIQEYSYEDIAHVMKISIASCRNLISKSLAKLKESALFIAFLLLFVR